MRTEYDTLVENNTWELTDRPVNKKILTNKWVFKLKKNQDGSVDKHKARLVARGHEQRPGIDYEEIFAPVARYENIRTLLAVAVKKNYMCIIWTSLRPTCKGIYKKKSTWSNSRCSK